MCGENEHSREAAGIPWGSSPRVRGKQDLRGRGDEAPGLIPACAGKTSGPCPRPSPSWAHPRVCGENLGPVTATDDGRGSSPRVRGKPAPARRPLADQGLIPACAGKTVAPGRTARTNRAHPRVCGENNHSPDPLPTLTGSSPRVRGKRSVVLFLGPVDWLIPACAGKTSRNRAGMSQPWAHPRVCGENGAATEATRTKVGSSPRVRGKLVEKDVSGAGIGLIPACAGKTFFQASASAARQAHPRVCGENESQFMAPVMAGGSSPRVRGKRRGALGTWPDPGLIPACAGKTIAATSSSSVLSAHPRVCGENGKTTLVGPLQVGSSPRVRGKPHRQRQPPDEVGLIPACAGKTSRFYRPWACASAHPRVCGENDVPVVEAAAAEGSSPRVLGKPSTCH